MEWLNIHVSFLDSVEFLGAEPTDRATWLCLLRWCAGQENGGVIEGARLWGDRKWQQLARVTLKEIGSKTSLWSWQGEALVLAAYPVAKEAEVKANRKNGSLGGRPAKPSGLPKNNHLVMPGLPKNNHPVTSGFEIAETEGKGKEGKGKEVEGKGAVPFSIGPTSDQLDICQPYPPGDVRVYPQVRSAKVGLVDWIVHHPRCIVGKDRDLWQGLFDYAGHETMSHAYARMTGTEKLWFSTFNDYIHENYEEDKPNEAQK